MKKNVKEVQSDLNEVYNLAKMKTRNLYYTKRRSEYEIRYR